MSAFIANVIVYLVVALSVGYAAWRLGPVSFRRWLALRLQRRFPVLLRNLPLSVGGCGSSCGGCSLAAKPRATPAESRVSTQIPIRIHQPKR